MNRYPVAALLSAAFFAAPAAFAAGSSFDLNRPDGASQAVLDARQTIRKGQGVEAAKPVATRRTDRMCDDLTFTADDPLTKSTDLVAVVEQCVPGWDGDPAHGGTYNPCKDRIAREEKRTVRLSLERPPLKPGQSERFQACLRDTGNGDVTAEISVAESPFQYRISKPSVARDGIIDIAGTIDESPDAPGGSSALRRVEGFGCKDFSFTSQSPDASESQTVTGLRRVHTCDVEGHPPIPVCEDRDEPVSEDVRIVLRDRRPLGPGQTETFRVCLDNGSPRWEEVSTVYEYHEVGGGEDGDIVLAPSASAPQKP